jgi:hypothetical protein
VFADVRKSCCLRFAQDGYPAAVANDGQKEEDTKERHLSKGNVGAKNDRKDEVATTLAPLGHAHWHHLGQACAHRSDFTESGIDIQGIDGSGQWPEG